MVPARIEPVSASAPAATVPPPPPLLACASAPASAGLTVACPVGFIVSLVFAAHDDVYGTCPELSTPVACDGSPSLPCPVPFRRSVTCDDRSFVNTALSACLGQHSCSLLRPASDPCPSTVRECLGRQLWLLHCTLLIPIPALCSQSRSPSLPFALTLPSSETSDSLLTARKPLPLAMHPGRWRMHDATPTSCLEQPHPAFSLVSPPTLAFQIACSHTCRSSTGLSFLGELSSSWSVAPSLQWLRRCNHAALTGRFHETPTLQALIWAS